MGASTKAIYVGDFQRGYTAVFYGQPIFVRDDVTSKRSVLFYMERRVGGHVTDSNPIKALQLSVS